MRVEKVPVGSRVVDSYPFSMGGTSAQAKAMKAADVDGFVGYLGPMTQDRLKGLLDAGLGFMPVTLANSFDGQRAVKACQALGLPIGTTVWLDLEGRVIDGVEWPALSGVALDTFIFKLSALVDAWAAEVKAAGYEPGLYVGAPQPLTGKELFARKTVRYWLGIGRCVDRFGKDAYPDCGWTMRQDWHGQTSGMFWRNTGVFVDTNSVQCDHRVRVPSWVVA